MRIEDLTLQLHKKMQQVKRLNLKQRLKKCFTHLDNSPIFGRHLIVLLLIIHLLIGFRRLREVDYYRDDPIVLRLMGLRKLPDVSTISRALSQLEKDGVDNVRQLSRSMVIEGLKRERLPHLTLDFDGSVQSTKGHRSAACRFQFPGLLTQTTRPAWQTEFSQESVQGSYMSPLHRKRRNPSSGRLQVDSVWTG